MCIHTNNFLLLYTFCTKHTADDRTKSLNTGYTGVSRPTLHTHTHARACVHTHTHARTHTHKNTNTHTHTHNTHTSGGSRKWERGHLRGGEWSETCKLSCLDVPISGHVSHFLANAT